MICAVCVSRGVGPARNVNGHHLFLVAETGLAGSGCACGAILGAPKSGTPGGGVMYGPAGSPRSGPSLITTGPEPHVAHPEPHVAHSQPFREPKSRLNNGGPS
jgi:hypothetical protein